MALERLEIGTHEWEFASADHLARYLFAAQFVCGKRVLDVGTGVGYGAALLKIAGAASVLAVDLDAKTLCRAQEAFGASGVQFVRDNAETLDGVLEPVDVVVSFENIEHLAHPDRFVLSAARSMAEEGLLICSTPDRRATPPFINDKPANSHHVNEWYVDEFRALLATGFRDVEVRSQVRTYQLARRLAAIANTGAWASSVSRMPTVRIWHALKAILGRTRHFPDLEPLGYATPADYPIIQEVAAPIFGLSWCHLGMCRSPVRRETY